MRFLPLPALILAATPLLAGDHSHDHEHHLAELEGIRVIHAWTPATDGSDALIFMEIENNRDDVVDIEGAESAIAERAHLVGFTLVDGSSTYKELPRVPVAPGSELVMAPNGVAIELHGLTQHLHRGDEFEIELETSAGHIDLHVQIEAEGAMQHSHAGHNH